jgi:hypothetical protein
VCKFIDIDIQLLVYCGCLTAVPAIAREIRTVVTVVHTLADLKQPSGMHWYFANAAVDECAAKISIRAQQTGNGRH